MSRNTLLTGLPLEAEGGILDIFEQTVTNLLDSVNDKNLKSVQRELIDFFKSSEQNNDTRVQYAAKAYELTNQFDDDRRSILLLSAALEVTWPDYPGGDGYFSEPSELASAATVIGINNSGPELIEFSKKLSPCKAIEFFDLGIAASSESTSEQVLFAASRTNLDPVFAVAAVSNALSKKQIKSLLAELDSASWLVAVLLKSDGWTWPDWQYAFEQATFNCEPTVPFWEVLLTEIGKNQNDDSSDLPWISEFIEEFENYDGLDPDVSGETFELFQSSDSLMALAMASNWDSLQEALESL